jgi:hypothetical protein
LRAKKARCAPSASWPTRSNATAALGTDTKPETVERAGHQVARHTYANAVAYFLRVHDGNIVNGNDFQEHPLSLQRLRSGASAETKAIDDSARYVGWADFVATLEAVIASELAPGTALNLHIAELDEKRNPATIPIIAPWRSRWRRSPPACPARASVVTRNTPHVTASPT